MQNKCLPAGDGELLGGTACLEFRRPLLSSPVLRNQAPWTVISELSCSLSSPCRLGGPRHGADGKEAVSGQGDLFGAGVEGAGHS